MRLHALQYLRAAAALAVVYHHAAQQQADYVGLLPHFGAFGVDVFFVISGFIMVWIAKPDDTPWRFITNRVRRVVPLYWFFTLLMAAILLLAPFAVRNSVFDIVDFGKSLLFIPYQSPGHPGELWPLVAPGWSLNYEMYFYLLFAVALFLPRHLRVAGVTVAITTVTLVAAVLAGGVDVGVDALSGDASRVALLSFFSETVAFEFVFGMLLAVAWRRGFRLPSATGGWLALLGLALMLLELPLPHALRYGIPSLLIVCGCLFVVLPEWRLGVLLGDSSYALYLSHVFVLGALRLVLPPVLEPALGTGAVSAWAFVLASLVICAVVGVVVHLVIDEWLLRRERWSMFYRASGRTRQTRSTPLTGSPPS